MNRFAKTFIVCKLLQRCSVGWFFATYVLFLLGNGLNQFQANLLNAIFMTVGFFADPPTGYLGDRIGQKRVYLAGLAWWGAGMFVYGFGHTFWIFALAESLGAIGSALMSESLESWLRNASDEETAHLAISRSEAISQLGVVPCSLAGSLIGFRFGLHWPWLLAGIYSVIALAVSFFLLRRHPDHQPARKQNPVLATPDVFAGFKAVFNHSLLRSAMIVGLVAFGAFQPFNMFWSPVLAEVTGQAWWLGSLWLGIALAISLGSWLASSRKLPTNRFGLAITLAAIGIPMVFPVWLTGYPLALTLCFVSHEIGRGSLRPLLFTFSNREIKDCQRTTVNSILSAGRTFGAALGLLISGALSLSLSRTEIWQGAAICLLILAIWTASRKSG